ncbi:MAG: hypothetical protein GY948_11035 [Alphaproteobacteria bacterium]|nr:hypothetical protein [Alphaproteobacteria bacterium]
MIKAAATKFYWCSLFLVIVGAQWNSPLALAATDADFGAYCRATFSNSAYQKFAQNWGTEHVCVQGGTRQAIDYSAACQITTGSSDYEIDGARVLCSGSPTDPSKMTENDLGNPDYAALCKKHFQNSVYERHPESAGTMHKCRQPGATGGFTFQNVDARLACQFTHATETYRMLDGQIICLKSDSKQAANADTNNGEQRKAEPLPTPSPSNPPKTPNPDPNVSNEETLSTTSKAANTKQEAEKAIKAACQNPDIDKRLIGLSSRDFAFSPKPILLGGDWKVATAETVAPFYQYYLKTMRERKNGKTWRFGQVSGVYKATAYWAIVGVLKCNMEVVRNAKYFNLAELNQAKSAACKIREILSQILGENAVLSSSLWTDWHPLLNEVRSTKNLCGQSKRKEQPARPPEKSECLSPSALSKEIRTNKAAIDSLKKEMAETRENTSYKSVNLEPLKQEIEKKYAEKKKEIEEKKRQLNLEMGKERDGKSIPSDCSSVGLSCRRELQERYGKLKKKLDDELDDYKDDLDDDLTKRHGDKKSRDRIIKLKAKLGKLKARQAKLEAEQDKRFEEADERAKKMVPESPSSDDEDEPLIPDEDLEEDAPRMSDGANEEPKVDCLPAP